MKTKRKGLYLSPEFVDAFSEFLIETTKMIRKARRDIRKKYPKSFEKKAN